MDIKDPCKGYAHDLREAVSAFNTTAKELASRGCVVEGTLKPVQRTSDSRATMLQIEGLKICKRI